MEDNFVGSEVNTQQTMQHSYKGGSGETQCNVAPNEFQRDLITISFKLELNEPFE